MEMKLYCDVESERAKKGQGGNKYIRVQLRVGSRDDSRIVAEVLIQASDTLYEVRYTNRATGRAATILQTGTLKGEKQKGEKICKQCGAKTKTALPRWNCSNCGTDN